MQNHSTGLLDDCVFEEVDSGTVVDVAECEGVMFVAIFGTAAGTNTMTLETGDAANGSDHAEVDDSKDSTDAALTMNATATVGVLQHHKPTKRYCNCVLNGSASMVAIKYGHRKQPTVQDAAKAVAAGFVSPA